MKSPKPEHEASPGNPADSAKVADVALVHAVDPDGSVHVIRRRGDHLEAGSLQPLREGAPIRGEVVALRPRANFPALCDVEVLYEPPAQPAASSEAPAAQRKGPAQIATASYRANWESIWSRKSSEQLN
ncbi:MAG TPA: hypothetical protein VIW29_16540 [Polyangiaceae bacterium]